MCAPLPEHEALSPADRAVIKARQGVELLTSGELRVVDELGGEVPADGVTLGEITVRGNVVMDGYYNDPEATKKAMGDGWFHTGDAAVVHPDGYIEIRDRIKDVIISGGENISSVEVEGALLRHPAVGEAAVVGLPSEKWGETPHAFVVLMPGASVTADELIAFVQGPDRALQGPARRHLRGRPAQDRDRQDPEVRPARRRGQPLRQLSSGGIDPRMAVDRRPDTGLRYYEPGSVTARLGYGRCKKGCFAWGSSRKGGGVGYGWCGRAGRASGRWHRAQGGHRTSTAPRS